MVEIGAANPLERLILRIGQIPNVQTRPVRAQLTTMGQEPEHVHLAVRNEA